MILLRLYWTVVNNIFSSKSVSEIDDSASRIEAFKKAEQLGVPSTELEDWRYSSVDEFDLSEFQPVTHPPVHSESESLEYIKKRCATITVINGWVTDIDIDSSWASKGLEISISNQPSMNLDKPENYFGLLHQACNPTVLGIKVKQGLYVEDPVVILNITQGEGLSSFPGVEIEVEDNCGLQIVELQTSDGPCLSVPLVEIEVGKSSNFSYLVIQDNNKQTWQFGRVFAKVESQATFDFGLQCLGSKYSRTFADVELVGQGATGKITSSYFGDDEQVHDFRIYQHHKAKDTLSDLLFKGVLGDKAKSIYTGLIHIHPEGPGSNAYQTNRNIKLSDQAWAWSVPNLEIENNDVKCSHASTVSPIDLDQQFYLQSRGVEPAKADKIIVNGFYDEAVKRMPVAEIHVNLSEMIKHRLDNYNFEGSDA